MLSLSISENLKVLNKYKKPIQLKRFSCLIIQACNGGPIANNGGREESDDDDTMTFHDAVSEVLPGRHLSLLDFVV